MTDKIHKTDEQWRAQLAPDQFRVARGKGTEPAFTDASAAANRCSTRQPSSTQEPAGRVSGGPSPKTAWLKKRTRTGLRHGRKFCAAAATPTSATSSTMVHSRR